MDKHTFKVGDRVFGQMSTGAKKVPGVFVKIGGSQNDGCVIRRDDGVSGIEPGLYWYGKHLTTHDTDFQVGDWVRYEGVHPRVVSPLLEGKVGKIEYLDGDSCAGIPQFHIQSGGVVYKENLVKIQPPQEESDNTIVHVFTSYTNKEEKMDKKEEQVDIVHRETGEIVRDVEGVLNPCYTWKKTQDDRETTFSIEHWKRYEEWVKIEVRKSQWDNVNKCCNVLEVQKKSDTYPDTCTLSWRYPQ